MNKIVMILFILNITSALASWGNPYKKFERNVPQHLPRSEDGRCIHYIIVNDKENGNHTATTNWYTNDTLEAYHCERMFAPRAIDFFTDPKKSSPAPNKDFDYAEFISLDKISDLSFKENHLERSKTITTRIIDENNEEYTNSNHPTISNLEKKRTSIQQGILRHRDYYRTYNPEHKDFYEVRNGFKITKSFLKESNDWDEILGLNIMAKDLWDDLVTSLGTSYARIFYFDTKNVSLDKELKKSLRERIQNFHYSMRGFLESTHIYDTGGISLVKNYHPLFVQVLLENIADFKVFYEGNSKDRNNQKFIKEILRYLLIHGKEEVTQDLYSHPRFSKKVSPGEERKNILRRYLNTMLLINMTDNKCEVFGLWPGASRWFQGLDQATGSISYSEAPIDYLMNRLQKRILKACGDFSPYKQFNFWGGAPLNYWNIGLKKKKEDIKYIYKNLLEKYSY